MLMLLDAPELMSPAEVREATGKARPTQQAEWLAEHGVPHHDEVGAYGGTTITFSPEGLMPSFESLRNDNTGEEEFADYFRRKAGPLATVTVTWDDNDHTGPCWVCTADVPHATFSIRDEGQPFGRGVVFSLADLANPSNAG